MGGKGNHPSSSESDDWGDGSWIVDCPCGVNYDDGEEMVECDECGVWVHTACCRVPKGLETYGCDKCKAKKKLKETEESEVAQLLAELPGKPAVSFDERNLEKVEAYIGHHPSLEISIEERVHVQGPQGGDPLFFEGASKVFCRQLWKYTGYTPKHLKIDDRELPDARDDVSELLNDLPDYKVPLHVYIDRARKASPAVLENSHAPSLPSGVDVSRHEVTSNGDVRGGDDALEDREHAKAGEGKLIAQRQMPTMKEEKPVHCGKRRRDEVVLKAYTSRKAMRNNGEVRKLQDGLWSKVDASPSEEAGVVGKSPLSSPKNPKAMKKLAGLEFMDGDIISCRTCGKAEPVSDLITGNASSGGSATSCQECGRVFTVTVPFKLEPGSLKQETVALTFPASVNTVTAPEVRVRCRGEFGNCDGGVRVVRFRADVDQVSAGRDLQAKFASPGKDGMCNDSSPGIKKPDADIGAFRKAQDATPVKDEKKSPPVKFEAAKSKHSYLETGSGEILEGKDARQGALPELESPVEKNSGLKGKSESLMKSGDCYQDMERLLASKPTGAKEAEARAPLDTKIAVVETKQSVAVGPHPTGNSLVIVEHSANPAASPPADPQLLPIAPRIFGPNILESAEGNGNMLIGPQGKVLPLVVAEAASEKTSKLLAAVSINTETRGQGSARTAGHLPASVRGKLHGERSHLQRSHAGGSGQQQATSPSGQSLVQPSLSGAVKTGQNSTTRSVSPSTKVSCADECYVGKHPGQALLECSSPRQQSVKQVQPARILVLHTTGAHKCPNGEVSSPPQLSSSSAQPLEAVHPVRSKEEPGALDSSRIEVLNLAVSPKQFLAASGTISDVQDSKPGSTQVTPPQVLCQQARQLNGTIGHVYTIRSKSLANSLPSSKITSSHAAGVVVPSQAPSVVLNHTKLSVSSLKSPSSGTSSSSPTSPLVTTPSSRPPPLSVKIPNSPPHQKSLSGSSTPNTSNPLPHILSKVPSSISTTTLASKQVGSAHSSKLVPSLPASPLATKVVSVSKQSSRSNSVPVSKSVDGSNSVAKLPSSVTPSRGGNHSGSSSGGLLKDSVKNVNHASSKPASVLKANATPVVTKPPSSKSSHNHVTGKVSAGASISKQHSGTTSGLSRSSGLSGTVKHSTVHHSKVGNPHKDEKPSMPPAPPLPKAMATMPPPPPQVSTKRPSPSAVATTLKDEELALLLHQELNSSPRVPRVPRVRQAGASLQLVSSPSLSSAKGSFASATSGGSSHKDHYPAGRKRAREDRQKDLPKNVSHLAEEGGKNGRKRSEEIKMEEWKSAVDAGSNSEVSDVKEKSSVSRSQSTLEGNARHHGFSKGNLSIIVPATDDTPDGDKKSPVDNNVTLPGLIDEVLSNRGHTLSYEDVCDAVLPHWPKLRKPNGDRYAYHSHRQAVLDCLRNRSAWSHLVNRGPKTNLGRKRRRNDSTTVSDTDDEEEGSYRDSDDLDTSKNSKGMKGLELDKGTEDASDRQRSVEADEVLPPGTRRARRRRKVAIEDGTDGEDEPNVVERASGRAGLSEPANGVNQEEEPEAESSPSSEEAVSNYSEEDEEMVVHRGMRNRRRPTDESSESEDDMD